ncbi:M56 family metallopeptidase [Tunicatimonas pelagia]|uniref:M56 family metallopeptidase n=1 Tax=Tunicatimonas pelagia TaxID=931531 RepID=UPI00266614A0|nr:M56 family metallopeptidase [Tunicatimonas pelagia]WKN43452.1 M56 family metallopeptidase [Tunicatimonas pelagia]
MTSLIVYLLEASVILVVLYALYLLLLRKETFFGLNRFFLLAIPVFSFLFPLLSFDVSLSFGSAINEPIEELSEVRFFYYDAFESWSANIENHTAEPDGEKVLVQEQTSFYSSLITIALAIYGIGFAVVIFRLIGLYIWVHRLMIRNETEVIDEVRVVKVSHSTAPFSFLNSVFVHQDIVLGEDFAQILAHEKVHIRERHSVDLLFVQLSAAVLWFNPVVWQLIKSLKTTHEYIADKKTIDQGYSLVAYQTLLLRQLVSTNSYGLIHHFNLSFIKKRITMMNVKKSGWAGKAKVVLTLFAVLGFSLVIVQCNSKLDEQMLLETEASTTGVSQEIDVPVITASHFKLSDPTATVDITVNENIVTVNGEVVELDELASVLEKEAEERIVMVLTIDRTQLMSLVRKVQREMRRANQLKVLYIGQTSDGQSTNVRLMLPPLPENNSELSVPIVTDEYARENNLNLLKVVMGENTGLANQQKTYDFVKDQVAQQKTNYVVSARFSDDNTYGEYLTNVHHLQKAFYQLYEERTQARYGEGYWDIFEKKGTDKKYAEMYSALKKEAPMAISIAED